MIASHREDNARPFLEVDRSVAETARRLHVHPHTVRYRIERIGKRLGDLSSHDERLALQIALRARRTQPLNRRDK